MNNNSSSKPHLFFHSCLLGAMGLVVGGCSTMTKAPTNATPSATVRIEQVSAAYYGSATTGKGTLHFQNQTRRFTISSVGVGGTGGLKVSATGKVFGLHRVSDFPGSYRAVSSGLTLFEGKMQAKLTNQKGVVIYLAGQTEGLASSGGVQRYQVNFTD